MKIFHLVCTIRVVFPGTLFHFRVCLIAYYKAEHRKKVLSKTQWSSAPFSWLSR